MLLDPLSLSHLLGPPPPSSSVTYFMDGPYHDYSCLTTTINWDS